MRKLVFSAILSLAAFAGSVLAAFEIEDHAAFGPPDAQQVLRVFSTTDIDYFEPMIRSFLDVAPEVRVDYTVASSSEVMRALHRDGAAFDLAISSAMDLQTKLANDGLARRHFPDIAADLPDWAVWNNMIFAFTQEPAAIVVSERALGGLPVPRSRQDLIRLLRQNPDRFRGRVGTYDVRASGLGYLFATQDTRASETYWRLMEVMGGLDARLYCCSSDMLRDVETGELAIAYNVLGSYAARRANAQAIRIILPSDFTTVMLRTMIIPQSAPSPTLAEAFADHVLDRSFGAQTSPLDTPDLVVPQVESILNRIRLGPGLLVYLDQFKKRSFLAEWESAIEQK